MRNLAAIILVLAWCLPLSNDAAAKSVSVRSAEPSDQGRLIPRKPASKAMTGNIGPEAEIERVIVKLVEGSRGRLYNGSIYSPGGKDLKSLNGIISGKGRGKISRLAVKNPEQVEREKYLLENKSGRQLADMNNYFSIEVSSAAEAADLVESLNRLPEVEIAYAEPRPYYASDIPPATPYYDSLQTYLRPAPEGFDADYIGTVPGGDGAGVRIVDVEGNWKFDHEDLEAAADGLMAGELIEDQNWRDHGTAVIGIMIGSDNDYGITGMAPGAEIDMVSIGGLGTTEAILTAIDSMGAGDILLMELHAPGPRYDFQPRDDQMGYVCMEYWQANFDAFQLAWAKGIIVCEAAGNGFEDLDDAIYENRFDTSYRNSHAIMVGAGAPPSGNYGPDRSKLDFSNYGQRLNLQGYGREVVTTGYGFLFSGGGDERQYYTGIFNGTSAAAPMVAGAVAALQGIYMNRYNGALIDADRVRDVLHATGSPQQPSDWLNIGPRPNLRAADSALPAPLDLSVDPGYFDTTLEVGSQISVYFEMHNNAAGHALDYDISELDSLARDTVGDWLRIIEPSGSIAPQDFVTIEVILDATVIEDRSQIYKGLIDIAWGQQGGPLDQATPVPVFVTVPCQDTTYSALSSANSGEVAFDWIDISGVGSVLPSYSWYNDFVTEEIMDDGTYGPLFMSIDIPFYDSVYKYIFVGANGAVSFTDTNVNVDGYYDPVPIPNPPFQTFVAPLWCDLNLDTASGGHGTVYWHRPHRDTLVIAWHDVAAYSFPDDSLTFEIILTRNGNIKFQYLSVGQYGMADSAVVGIAENDCRSLPFVLQGEPVENIVGDSAAVLFDYAYIIWEMAGDANNDRQVNVGDAVFLINWIFKGGEDPYNMLEADANCSGQADVGDAVYLINYVFKSGPEPCSYEL